MVDSGISGSAKKNARKHKRRSRMTNALREWFKTVGEHWVKAFPNWTLEYKDIVALLAGPNDKASRRIQRQWYLEGVTLETLILAAIDEAGEIAQRIERNTGEGIRFPVLWMVKGIWGPTEWLRGPAEERAVREKEKRQLLKGKREPQLKAIGSFMTLGEILLQAQRQALKREMANETSQGDSKV
jgi:hypothetical protein